MQAIYLDHAATTPMRPEVRDAMLPFLGERYGNPSSTHRWGRRARNAVEESRERVAAALGAGRREILFTAGGTEADNLAVLGRWRCSGAANRERIVVCSAIEHKAILAAVAEAAREGAETIYLGVDADGCVQIEEVDEALRARPCLISIMWGNNEVGAVQPIDAIARRCAEKDVAFHTDAVQAFGKVRVRVDETPVCLLSLSGHKIGGPQGVGALFVREGVTLHAVQHGGGQERELRPGTENVAGVVGFAHAVELAAAEQAQEAERVAALRDELESALRERVPELRVNGAGGVRLPHVLNVTVPGADQEALIIGLDLEGIAASGGSACQSGTVKPSHVLVAMGAAEAGAANVRLSLGHDTTAAEIGPAAEAFAKVAARCRMHATA